MFRLFSIIVFINWFIVMVAIAVVGLGGSEGGLFAQSMVMLTQVAGDAGQVVRGGLIGFTLLVATAGLWAMMAVFFGDQTVQQQSKDEDRIVFLSLGFCVCFFALLLGGAIFTGNSAVSVMAAVASFATVLAGTAHRVFCLEKISREQKQTSRGLLAAQMRSRHLAEHSAFLATTNQRSRLVPKS